MTKTTEPTANEMIKFYENENKIRLEALAN